jgi:hypothetical protein
MDWSCDGSGTGGQGWYDLALAADPADANKIYAGGVDVWKSSDGGITWAINSHWYGDCSVPSVHADCHYLGFSPVDGQLYAGNDGGVFATPDGGATWNYKMVGVTIGQIYKLGQGQQSKNHVINGFQDNGSYTLTPAGWLATGGGDGMECIVDYAQDAYTYYTIYYGDIYRRYNNNNENHIAGNGINGITESGAWVTPYTLSATDPNTMFIGYRISGEAPMLNQGPQRGRKYPITWPVIMEATWWMWKALRQIRICFLPPVLIITYSDPIIAWMHLLFGLI